MAEQARALGVALVAIVALVGCARQVEIVRLEANVEGVDAAFENLLVVAVAGDEDRRQTLEDGIVRNVRNVGASASAGYSMFPSREGILLSDIETAAQGVDADGILLMRITQVETSAERAAGKEHLISTCRGGDLADYFLYDREVLKEPDSIRLAHTVVVVSELYDVQSRERIWVVQSTCVDRQNLAEALQDEADAIVRQLRRDRLI